MTEKLAKLIHTEVTARELLRIYLNSATNTSHRREFRQAIDEGARLIGRFYFVIWHTEQILWLKYGRKCSTDASHKAFPILHFADESTTELFHSLLVAENGLILQAIHALRRFLETMAYGSFFSLSTLLTNDGTEFNPFMLMEGTGVWPRNAGRDLIRLSDLKRLISNETLEQVLTNFTAFYITNFATPRCREHTVDRGDECIAEIPTQFGRNCVDCARSADTISFRRVPTLNLMLVVLLNRLGTSSDINTMELYHKLSNYIHPNPLGHQHGPSFEIARIREWLKLLRSVVDSGFWMYSGTLRSIEFHKPEISSFEAKHGCRLSRLNLQTLRNAYCETMLSLSDSSH